jgi:hypothetical protein
MVFWLRNVYGLERTVQAVYNWVHTGVNGVKLPTIVVGGHLVIDLEVYERWRRKVAESYVTKPSKRGRPRKDGQPRKRACLA